MADKPQNSAGLRGQSAGTTALCTVGKTGSGLTEQELNEART